MVLHWTTSLIAIYLDCQGCARSNFNPGHYKGQPSDCCRVQHPRFGVLYRLHRLRVWTFLGPSEIPGREVAHVQYLLMVRFMNAFLDESQIQMFIFYLLGRCSLDAMLLPRATEHFVSLGTIVLSLLS